MSLEEIKQLDITERILLVEEIWDSIATEQEHLPLSSYEKKILDKRLALLEENPSDLLSWDEIKKRLRS